MDPQNNQPEQFSQEPSTSPTAPAPAYTAPEQTPITPAPKKKRLIVGLIVAAVLVVLGGGAVLAYNFWYQNPEKVVTDGIMNAMKAESVAYKGSIAVTGKQDVSVEMTGRVNGKTGDLAAKLTVKQDGKNIVINGDGLLDAKGDLYMKVSNLDAVLKEYRNDDNPELQALLDKLVAKVNNQWIKVSSDELKPFSQGVADSQKCLTEAIEKLKTDKTLSSEVGDVYKKNRFITVNKKLGSKDGSLGYEISSNDDTAKNFVKELKSTKLYKSVQDCDKSFKLDENEIFKKSDNSSNERVELWVDRWSHQITKFNAETTQDGNTTKMTVETKFNEKVEDAKTPEKSMTITQLKADIEALVQSAMTQAMPTEAELEYDMSTQL